MSVIDVAVVVGYLALMLVIGYFSGKDNESQEDYFWQNVRCHGFQLRCR